MGHLEEHLDWMHICGMSENTLRARRMVLTWLAESVGHDPATATPYELRRWQATISSHSYLRWQTLIIRPYFRWLQASGYRTDNPAALLPMPKRKRRLPRPIPEDRLFAAVVEAPDRIRPWLLLAGWCGLRADEIARLRTEDVSVDPDGGVFIRFLGKGEVEREVPMPGWVWVAIQPLLPTAPGPCFGRPRRADAGKPLKGKHVTDAVAYYFGVIRGIPDRLHSLRHRVATEALRESGDLRLVQDLLGHASLATVHIYTKVQPQDMARTLSALPRPLLGERAS
ncbi:MAG: hypothetical protein ABT15_06980 [Pseudonocardia sp. SCN 73-27]|nr:MAG: hypothetical protein ABS80_03340 [Pseudonocardia sp. SCN 72-51]ODV07931.1 MAG: hypothetical protein ABT15_06980 [Pseudonocardia sp. SCN 73-27]